ncbi:transient receptor potential cation channel subfamily A member 1 [Elysia marginata]|uniref:Transient receptor potential cation channel subfamily A member 1 n=1 Tax=Elysia marginata TaxID=1093978 RepID=A0AAV4IG62_9GAST|nr:transient receptor potential cation channel subfamily A member 1 [Elysia marginata]
MATDTIQRDTPLHVACFYGLLDVIIFLVQRGASVNSLNNSHQTPLDKLLSLCQHPSKNSSTRSRLLTAHLLTRFGFKVNPKAQGQRQGTRCRILYAYNKARICSDCPSLLHISRLRVRELLPPSHLEAVVTSLSIPVDLQDFLLFRPMGLDHHVTCSHVEDLICSLSPPPFARNK